MFQIAALLLSITALFSYVNFRLFKLPTTIGVMLIALMASVAVVGAAHLGFGGGLREQARHVLERIDFDDALMQGMLSFMLFAGSLHVNLSDLAEQKYVVLILATAGTLISAVVVGSLIYLSLGMLGLGIGFPFCLLFGALISPTDPIAVLAILKSARIPKSVEIRIAGESLFNDGVAVVIFLVLAEIALGGREITVAYVAGLFFLEAVGGAVFGFVFGWIAYRMLRSVDNYQVEVLLTLALVSGGYALASALHVSGPIAIVVAGLFIGNHGRRFAMSERTRDHLDKFWELVDEILNAVLFVLIGFEILALSFTARLFAAGAIAVPVVLAARWMSVAIPFAALRRHLQFKRGELVLLTWGGLRGGISVALALSMPPGREREIILAMTYLVVVCSIAAQGLTIRRVVQHYFGESSGRTANVS